MRARYQRVPRSPALDGLRGVAIAAVVLFHYPTHRIFVGGLFGVGLFFVLSGFLITPVMTSEYSRLGRVRVGRFLGQRVWRLLPALLAFLVAMLIATALFGRQGWFTSNPFGSGGPGAPLSVAVVLKGSAAALTYTYNLFLAHRVRMAPPFGHLWTLAVEGQFYLGWALLVAWVVRRRPRALLVTTIVVMAASAVSPFVVWDGGAHQALIYFATFPQLEELLAGALLAQLWSLGVLRRLPVRVTCLGAALGGVALLWLVFGVGDVPFKYLGAFTVVAAGGALVVAHLIDDRTDSLAQQALRARPVVWLGQRSYGLYLWHWPFAEWTNRLPHPVGVPLGITASLIAAELSWRLVEAPAQRWRTRHQRGRFD